MINDELVENMIIGTLGYRPGDAIVMLHDDVFKDFCDKIADGCRRRSLNLREVCHENYSGTEGLSDRLSEHLLSPDNNILILGFGNNIWHTSERKKAKYEMKKRLVNLLYAGFDCDSLYTKVCDIEELSRRFFSVLKECEGRTVEIASSNGTDLVARVGEVFCEDGNYALPGRGGDYPAGEVGFGPLDGSVNGTLVYDVKIQHIGRVDLRPLRVTIRDDEVVSVSGEYEGRFRDLINSHTSLKFVSEISVGTNPVVSTVSDTSSIVEEKNIGTAHIGNGGNSSYGTRKGPHFDGVFAKPSIEIENRLLMKDGVAVAF